MQKERRKNKLTGLLRDWRLYLLMVPSLVYLIIFAYVPMYGVQIAFRNFSVRKGIWGSDWVGLEHFKRFRICSEPPHLVGSEICAKSRN